MKKLNHLNMGNILYFHLDHSCCYLFYLFKFQDQVRKKNSSDFRVYGTQNDRLETTVSTQTSVLKYMSPEILAKMYSNLVFQPKCQKFLTFLAISQDLVHIFQNRFLHWNHGFKPVVLSNMNPIIRRIFFWLIKGL